jgi:hypothetical protein
VVLNHHKKETQVEMRKMDEMNQFRMIDIYPEMS